MKIGGAPLEPALAAMLTSGQVDLSTNLPGAFQLRFRDANHEVIEAAKAKIAAPVVITAIAAGDDEPKPLLTGEITAVDLEFDATGRYTVIRGLDAAHRLHRGRRTEMYAQSTASDVARKVAARAGLQVGKVDATTTVYEHLCQGGVTDYEFLAGLAREVGYQLAVVDGKFSFRQPPPAADAPLASSDAKDDPLVLLLGTDLVRVRCSVTSAEQVKQVEVRGWDVAQKKALVGTAPAQTVSAVNTEDPAKLAKPFGNPVHVVSDVPYGTQAEVDTAAKAVAEQIGGAFVALEGVALGNPLLRAGTAVAMAGLGAPFDGKYTITTARHRYEPTAGYSTSFTVTGGQDRSLLGLSNGGRPSREAPGVVIAQVTDVKDPLDSGRVKVTFPWLSENYVSDWARTVQPGAGKQRGATIVPEVGDEVLVAFERGDMRRPFVLGGLYNGIDKPKPGEIPLVDPGSGAINRRSFVSRRGHHIDLHDQMGRKEGIVLASGDGKVRIEMDSLNMKITVHSDGTVLLEGPRGVVVDAGLGKLELKGQAIELTALTGVTVDGGTGPVTVATAASLELSGTTAKLEASAMAEIKGALVKIN